jgi:hypothetical protein
VSVVYQGGTENVSELRYPPKSSPAKIMAKNGEEYWGRIHREVALGVVAHAGLSSSHPVKGSLLRRNVRGLTIALVPMGRIWCRHAAIYQAK